MDHLAAPAGNAPAAPDLPEGLGWTQCPHGYLEPVSAAEPPRLAPESPERRAEQQPARDLIARDLTARAGCCSAAAPGSLGRGRGGSAAEKRAQGTGQPRPAVPTRLACQRLPIHAHHVPLLNRHPGIMMMHDAACSRAAGQHTAWCMLSCMLTAECHSSSVLSSSRACVEGCQKYCGLIYRGPWSS